MVRASFFEIISIPLVNTKWGGDGLQGVISQLNKKLISLFKQYLIVGATCRVIVAVASVVRPEHIREAFKCFWSLKVLQAFKHNLK